MIIDIVRFPHFYDIILVTFGLKSILHVFLNFYLFWYTSTTKYDYFGIQTELTMLSRTVLMRCVKSKPKGKHYLRRMMNRSMLMITTKGLWLKIKAFLKHLILQYALRRWGKILSYQCNVFPCKPICQPLKCNNASKWVACRTSNISGVFPGDGAIQLMTQDRGSESMSHLQTSLTFFPHDRLTNKGFLVSLGHSSPRDPFAAIKSPINQGFLPETIATPILPFGRVSILINNYLTIWTLSES